MSNKIQNSFSRFIDKIRNVGPAALVTAAFIGPGTVTTCTLAGADFGYALLWGLLFSVIATMILQEMAARLGIITQKGLGEAIHFQFKNVFSRIIAIILVISAIAIGNAAYETGNLLGASLGLETITGISSLDFGKEFSISIWGPVIGIIAFFLLLSGSYKLLERFLIVLVVLMSLTFLTTTILISPDLKSIFKGTFAPSIPNGSALTLIALIGTTVVPYNLFLHASAVKERFKDASSLKNARIDIGVSLGLGGIISMSIVITSAAAFFMSGSTISNAADMAVQLEPLLGSWAKYFLAMGFFAAGISSAITAPLAAAYATSGILNWKLDMKSWKFKSVWIIILLIGIIFSAIGFKPVQAILFAQVANGILLPIIAIYLLWIMNNKKLLGNYINSVTQNILGAIIVLITIGLGLKSILSVIDKIF
jgi:manganese transport protein